MGTYFNFLYSKYGLIVSNVLFDILDIFALCWCASEPNLKDYFESIEYLAFNSLEAIKNIVYFGVLFYHGVLLLRKLWNHSYEERMQGSSVSKVVHNYFDGFRISGSNYDDFDSSSGPPIANDKDTTVFLTVVVRLTIVLFLCFLCFSLRVAMEIVKIVYSRHPGGITTESFTHNGVAWFFCSDFIPRVIPSLAFMYLMRKKKQGRNSTHDSEVKLETENVLHMQYSSSSGTQ